MAKLKGKSVLLLARGGPFNPSEQAVFIREFSGRSSEPPSNSLAFRIWKIGKAFAAMPPQPKPTLRTPYDEEITKTIAAAVAATRVELVTRNAWLECCDEVENLRSRTVCFSGAFESTPAQKAASQEDQDVAEVRAREARDAWYAAQIQLQAAMVQKNRLQLRRSRWFVLLHEDG